MISAEVHTAAWRLLTYGRVIDTVMDGRDKGGVCVRFVEARRRSGVASSGMLVTA